MTKQTLYIDETDATKIPSVQTQRATKKRRIRWVAFISFLLILAAWVYGYANNGVDYLPLVKQVLPGADRIETRGDLYIGFSEDGAEVTGYAAIGSGSGYAGPIEMMVGVSPTGEVTGISVIQHRETPSFFRLLSTNGFFEQFLGATTEQHRFSTDGDFDAISGATLSSEGVASGIRQSIEDMAGAGYIPKPLPNPQAVQFGVPEIVLIALFAAGYFGHQMHNTRWKRAIRWTTLITGMVVLGFVYNAPLTISQVTSLLSGYWPDWHNNLYWFLLLGGILFVTTAQGKNPYCQWFCPFGAYQECLAAMSGAKVYRPRKLSRPFKWIQRGLAFTAVLLGLALRQPGIASYEPFAALFDFQANIAIWVLLLVITIASLVIKRPWCTYLCPLDPVVDFIGEGRRWIQEVNKKWRKQKASV